MQAQPRTALDLRDVCALLLCYGALVALVYRSALFGPLQADDPIYYAHNPFVHELSWQNLLALLDPRSHAHLYAYNYAPLHLLAVAGLRALFGWQMLGHHLVNLALHVGNCILLAALLLRSGVPRTATFLAGAVFAVHPANVEAVAWISQLKSVGALSLGLGALLALRRHPAVASLLFLAALLVKFSAAAFLPMAAAFAWARGEDRRTWVWLGVWALALGAVLTAQLYAFSGGGAIDGIPRPPLAVTLRTIAAIGAHYLFMAATGLGLSAYHEPAPALSALDPRWLAGLALGALLALRAGFTLVRRREEAAWWISAAAAFVPISQWIPFRFPVADRYLYFMLPGLIGAVLLAARPFATPRRARAGLAAGLAWVAAFALLAAPRAALWADPMGLLIDAARHYPDGSHGHYLRAVRAAQRADAEAAVAELRRAEEKTRISLVRNFDGDPLLAGIQGHPLFREFVLDTARSRIELVRQRGLRRGEGLLLATKHAALGQYDEAIALVEQELREGNPRREELLVVLDDLRARRREGLPDD